MDLDEIDVVNADTGEALVNAAGDTRRREIEVRDSPAVARDFGGEDIAIAGNGSEGLAEDCFGFGGPIIRSGIDQVDAVIEGHVDRADALGLLDITKSGAEGGTAGSEGGDFDASGAEGALNHRVR